MLTLRAMSSGGDANSGHCEICGASFVEAWQLQDRYGMYFEGQANDLMDSDGRAKTGASRERSIGRCMFWLKGGMSAVACCCCRVKRLLRPH